MKFDIKKLLKPDVYDHPVSDIELIETHISWIILTGQFAYKIKKPVNFGFLDFSTLEKRKYFCEQEVSLNKRLARGIYLKVVGISGSLQNPIVSERGEAIEYAVKMVQFPQSAQLDNKLAEEGISVEQIYQIARMVAEFHQTTSVTKFSSSYGSSDLVKKPIKENFDHITDCIQSKEFDSELTNIHNWFNDQFVLLDSTLKRRKKDGFIRECHGDMHLRNMVWLDEIPMAFDCIEFNPELRWIDVISEVAFLVMDLQDRKQMALANHFLNTYLEITGDYAGLAVLPFYLCYRAMVRAKVDALSIKQRRDNGDKQQLSDEFVSYLELASSYTKVPKPRLIIMRGMSASGKSTLSGKLLDKMRVIRIRSDIERKRLFNVSSTSVKLNTGIYSSKSSVKTYARLLELAEGIINAGYSVIVDATFLKHDQRQPFEDLADTLGVMYTILEVTASADELRRRIVARKNDVSDANLEVLEAQLANWQPLNDSEKNMLIRINTEESIDSDELLKDLYDSH